MMTHDSAIACQRHRTKSKFGLLKICMIQLALDAQRRAAWRCDSSNSNSVFDTKIDVNRFDEQADRQRRREAADRAGAELEQERRRDERRDVRVEQRQEHAAEAGVDRRRARRAARRAPP